MAAGGRVGPRFFRDSFLLVTLCTHLRSVACIHQPLGEEETSMVIFCVPDNCPFCDVTEENGFKIISQVGNSREIWLEIIWLTLLDQLYRTKSSLHFKIDLRQPRYMSWSFPENT
jgi:hypothetical protein